MSIGSISLSFFLLLVSGVSILALIGYFAHRSKARLQQRARDARENYIRSNKVHVQLIVNEAEARQAVNIPPPVTNEYAAEASPRQPARKLRITIVQPHQMQ